MRLWRLHRAPASSLLVLPTCARSEEWGEDGFGMIEMMPDGTYGTCFMYHVSAAIGTKLAAEHSTRAALCRLRASNTPHCISWLKRARLCTHCSTWWLPQSWYPLGCRTFPSLQRVRAGGASQGGLQAGPCLACAASVH